MQDPTIKDDREAILYSYRVMRFSYLIFFSSRRFVVSRMNS